MAVGPAADTRGQEHIGRRAEVAKKSCDLGAAVRQHVGVALHEDQVEVQVGVVRRLIDDQFPRWAALPVTPLATGGTVNAIFRVGDGLAARFPLRDQPAEQVRSWLTGEAAAAAEFAVASTVPAPQPVALGAPGHGYLMPWSVQTWVPGRDATIEDPADSLTFAADLATLIMSLRGVNRRERVFQGRGRGGHLPDHDGWMATCVARSEGMLDTGRLSALWAELRDLPRIDADVMTHADLTPANVLVEGGRLVGVLDTGGFGPADPALDLVAAWHLLDAGPRDLLRSALADSELTWRRGAAWALEQAMGAAWYYATSHPVMSAWAQRTLQRLLTADELR